MCGKDENKKELDEGGTVKGEDGSKGVEEEIGKCKPSSDIQVNVDSVQQAKMEDEKGNENFKRNFKLNCI